MLRLYRDTLVAWTCTVPLLSFEPATDAGMLFVIVTASHVEPMSTVGHIGRQRRRTVANVGIREQCLPVDPDIWTGNNRGVRVCPRVNEVLLKHSGQSSVRMQTIMACSETGRTKLEVSARAADKLEYWPFVPTVMAPLGGA